MFAQQNRQFNRLEEEFVQGRLSASEVIVKYSEYLEAGNIQKCGTPALKFMERHKDVIEAPVRQRLSPFAADIKAKTLSNYFISVGGKFKVYYETTGNHAVPLDDSNGNGIPDYVEWVAEAFDYSYEREVVELSFPDPIPPGTSYEVFLENIGGVYGMTRKDPYAPGGTHIQMHKNFLGFPENDDPDGNQRGSIRVTAAHEFKHAIQFVQNEWKGDADKWAEMDATLMEEVVYDNVNDYLHYLENFGSIFTFPENSFIPGSYQHVTWALYFYEKFGDAFWTNVWQKIEANPLSLNFLDVVTEEVTTAGANYGEALTENYIWHFASGPFNYAPSFGFKDRARFPNPHTRLTIEELSDSLSNKLTLNKYAAHFYEVKLPEVDGGQVRLAFSYIEPGLSLGLVAYLRNGRVETQIIPPNSGGYTDLYGKWNWYELDRLGIVALNGSATASLNYQYAVFTETYLMQNYPNPFNPSTTISYGITEQGFTTLEVFDILGRRVATLVNEAQNPGSYHIRFDGAGLASGVYLYRLKTSQNTFIKKMMYIK